MYHELLCDATFWAFLFTIDRRSGGRIARQKGCAAVAVCMLPITHASRVVGHVIFPKNTATA